MGIIDSMGDRIGFGRDPAKRVRERVTYSATDEGKRQIEEYRLNGIRENILATIVLKEGSCTMADLENKTHQRAEAIHDELEDMKQLGWLRVKGGLSSGGGSPFPGGYQYPYQRR